MTSQRKFSVEEVTAAVIKAMNLLLSDDDISLSDRDADLLGLAAESVLYSLTRDKVTLSDVIWENWTVSENRQENEKIVKSWL